MQLEIQYPIRANYKPLILERVEHIYPFQLIEEKLSPYQVWAMLHYLAQINHTPWIVHISIPDLYNKRIYTHN